MNIFEYCEKYHISLAKARKQMRDGVLRIDETTSEAITEIRHCLSRGQTLTAAQLVELIENPGSTLDLWRYAGRADEQLSALGDARNEIAPKHIAACVTFAAKGEAESIDALLSWLQQIIPARPVGHSYIAVRLLLGIPASLRQFDIPRIPRALHECRRREEFAEWWRKETPKGRSVTIYQRPAKKQFDL